MSSIYGKYYFDSKPVNPDELSLVEKALNYWNADDTNSWTEGSVGFGHLMLYNTPESLNEKLPLHFVDKGLTITADARIDNREELFIKLDTPVSEQKNTPDSTLILKAYEKYERNCVQHLIGDFAFAIWDANQEQLFCARDHLGVRPLYYFKNDSKFAFASEIKGLLAIDDANATGEINEEYLLKVVGKIPLLHRETVYKNIFRLGPAEALTLKDKRVQLHKYWELDVTKETLFNKSEDYHKLVLEKFEEAIRCRMRSAYPVGTELSGGLDSSGITCVAAKLLHNEKKTISCFAEVIPEKARPDNTLPEEFFVDEVNKFAAIDHLEKIPIGYNSLNYRPGKFLEDIDLTLLIADGPNDSFASFSNQLKKSASANNVRTLFSGFLGDNLVTSYKSGYLLDYVYRKKYLDFFREAKAELGLFQAFKTLLKIQLRKPVRKIFKKYSVNKAIRERKESSRSFLNEEAFKKVQNLIEEWEPTINYREIQKQSIEALHVSVRFENEISNGKMYKVEPCFPMADIRLLELVLSIPTSEKNKAGQDRLLFRKAMKDQVPDALLDFQPKFNRPAQNIAIRNWLLRQEETKVWLQKLDKQNLLPDFIDYNKFNKAYNLTEDSISSNVKDLEIFGRISTESIIRWYEKKHQLTGTSKVQKQETGVY